MRELERLLGRKTMEVEILKEALDLARAKKPTLLSRSPASGRFPVKTVAETLEVARSNLIETAEGSSPCTGTADTARRCGTGGRHPSPRRPAADLWLQADRRAPQARAAIRRPGPGQRQAGLSPDEEAWAASAAPHRPPDAPRA